MVIKYRYKHISSDIFIISECPKIMSLGYSFVILRHKYHICFQFSFFALVKEILYNKKQ